MIFLRNKKEKLWRLASENTKAADRLNNQPQQQHHHQHQHHPQERIYFGEPIIDGNSNQLQIHIDRQHTSTPPPPYCSSTNDNSTMSTTSIVSLNTTTPIYGKSLEASLTTSTEIPYCHLENGIHTDGCHNPEAAGYCNYENFSADIENREDQENQTFRKSNATTLTTYLMNMLQKCCGSECNSKSYSEAELRNKELELKLLTPRQFFDALLDKFNKNQIAMLWKILNYRLQPIDGTAAGKQHPNTIDASLLNCIQIPNVPISNIKPYVIMCRLFFWNDLKIESELKRLPNCMKENHNSEQICCNPMHWFRIVNTETGPPHLIYQTAIPERLNIEDFGSDVSSNENGKEEFSSSLNSESTKTIRTHSGLRVRLPEGSVKTVGDGDRPSFYPTNWCRLAYWEERQRHGQQFSVIKSTVHIYSDGETIKNDCQGLCLKALIDAKPAKSHTVQNARQKIGLGITLHYEADVVWLFNRSTQPIFLQSPTLSTSMHMPVHKIWPGECLKAFDRKRAQYLSRIATRCHVEPMDKYCMRLSFGKGWGSRSYKRQDVTCCPCWLEIIINQR